MFEILRKEPEISKFAEIGGYSIYYTSFGYFANIFHKKPLNYVSPNTVSAWTNRDKMPNAAMGISFCFGGHLINDKGEVMTYHFYGSQNSEVISSLPKNLPGLVGTVMSWERVEAGIYRSLGLTSCSLDNFPFVNPKKIEDAMFHTVADPKTKQIYCTFSF